MKSSEYKAKPQPHASRAQGPFFNPDRQATFFSGERVQREPFFNPSRVAPTIQAKLTVGAVGDRYEQEADRVAANVVSQINDSSAQVSSEQKTVRRMGDEEEDLQMKPIAEKIQRMGMEEEDLQMKPMLQRVGHEGGAVSTDLEAEIQSARGSGQALAPDLQAQMGQAMGADFSGVRVHTDAQSDRLNQSIQARAFTTGQDVFFRQGAYEPGSRGGQELIAHELTHVVQQNNGRVQHSSHFFNSLSSTSASFLNRQSQNNRYKPVSIKRQISITSENLTGNGLSIRRFKNDDEEKVTRVKTEIEQIAKVANPVDKNKENAIDAHSLSEKTKRVVGGYKSEGFLKPTETRALETLINSEKKEDYYTALGEKLRGAGKSKGKIPLECNHYNALVLYLLKEEQFSGSIHVGRIGKDTKSGHEFLILYHSNSEHEVILDVWLASQTGSSAVCKISEYKQALTKIPDGVKSSEGKSALLKTYKNTGVIVVGQVKE